MRLQDTPLAVQYVQWPGRWGRGGGDEPGASRLGGKRCRAPFTGALSGLHGNGRISAVRGPLTATVGRLGPALLYKYQLISVYHIQVPRM